MKAGLSIWNIATGTGIPVTSVHRAMRAIARAQAKQEVAVLGIMEGLYDTARRMTGRRATNASVSAIRGDFGFAVPPACPLCSGTDARRQRGPMAAHRPNPLRQAQTDPVYSPINTRACQVAYRIYLPNEGRRTAHVGAKQVRLSPSKPSPRSHLSGCTVHMRSTCRAAWC
jgi:hypothetical protein